MDYRHISGRSLSGRRIEGRSIGMRVSGGGAPGRAYPAPYPPALAWDLDAADSTPDFDVDVPSGNGAPGDIVANDVLRIEYSSDAGGHWSAYLTHTMLSGDIGGTPFTVSGTTPLGSGSYLFRGRFERGVYLSDWSGSESVILVIAVAAYKRNVILVIRAR